MSPQSSQSPRSPSSDQVGRWGEQLVAQWLSETGWTVLHERWRCRWGELDLVVGDRPKLESALPMDAPRQPNPQTWTNLAFVEVKVRRRGNWDANGLLAITPQKQLKLERAAQVFLATYPEWATCACRFDVALVSYCPRRSPPSFQGTVPSQGTEAPTAPRFSSPIAIGTPVMWDGYQFRLEHYLPAAFDSHP